MSRLRPLVIIILVAAVILPQVAAADRASKEAEAELEFGYDAAKRGYWQEALMRFRSADRLEPGNPEVLNNIAVALEATARYEEAREAYQRALESDPGNRVVQRNFAQFQDFYREFIAEPEEEEEGKPGEEGEADAEAEEDEGAEDPEATADEEVDDAS